MGSPMREPWSDRICGGVCVAFATWTVCCHAVVALGGSLRPLLWLSAGAALALVALALLRRRRASGVGPADGALASPVAAARSRSFWIAQLALGIVALAGTLALSLSGYVIFLWAWLLFALAAAAVPFLLVEEPVQEAPASGRRLEIGLFAVALVCALLTLVAHRPDVDDSFYVNLAVAAADDPDLPLLRFDTLHGIPDLPIHLPVYRVHSYEIWNGALSYLSGMPAIQCFHWISATLAALLVPLAHARLFRRLVPRHWLAATAALCFLLFAVGGSHRWYANFAFVRIWQGKGIALFVFLPLVYAFAIEFAQRPSARGWLRLLAAQIAALGCTANALWVAPIAAFSALASALRPTPRGLRIAALGALASAYVLGAGLVLKQNLEAHALAAPLARIFDPGSQLHAALDEIFGEGAPQTLSLAAVAAAWAFCGRGFGQRFAIGVPLAVTVVLLNPYADAWVRQAFTGPSYWRVFWSLPVPILLALVLVSPLELARLHPSLARRRFATATACALACVTLAVCVPPYSALSRRNRTEIDWPRLKVHPTQYAWAGYLNAAVPPGSTVVSPPNVTAWLTTQHHHAYPVIQRIYLNPHRELIGEKNLRLRHAMTGYADGSFVRPDAAEWFARGLALFDVKGVCLKISKTTPEARHVLRRSGYRRTLKGEYYEIWVRGDVLRKRRDAKDRR